MKRILRHHRIEAEIILESDTYTTLAIESPSLLRTFLDGVERQIETGEPFFHLYDGNKEIPFEKSCYFIRDCFNPALDNKKVENTITKEVVSSISDEEQTEFQRLINELSQWVEKVAFDFPIPLTIETDINPGVLLKALSLSPHRKTDDFLENLVLSIRILSHVTKKNVFILYNLQDYLSEDELYSFHKEMQKMEIVFFILTSHLPLRKTSHEKIIRIDEDLFEQHIDFKTADF